MSSGCITREIYPHCSGVSQVAATICRPLFTLLQRFDVAAGEGDADAVDGDLGLNRCLASVLESLHEWGNDSINTQTHTKKNLTRLDCHEIEPNFVTI